MSATRGTILAVDDNEEALFALEKLLKQEGFEVLTATRGDDALKTIRREQPDIALLDVVMPGMDGYEVTKAVKADAELRYIPIVLLTSKDELDDVIFGLEQGADDYIKKPFRREELLARINAVLRTKRIYSELRQSNRERRELKQLLAQENSYSNMIGRSQSMRQLFDLLEKVKDADVPVLITGESGSGKELVAAALHYASRRREFAFVTQNCSAFNENILESELFGHVKGAFSGALRDKQGLFEIADRGTFFLDELGEMSLALQARLLRVLENGTFTPVGATREHKADVRVVAATNRDLERMVKEGKFREDLYYRLNVIRLRLPALRERREDIPLLIEHFLAQIAARSLQTKRTISSGTLRLLCDYSWPGNIRELRNEIERLVLLSPAGQEIGEALLSPQVQGLGVTGQAGSAAQLPSSSSDLNQAIQQLERSMILAALKRLDWNKSEAARELGISRSSLIAKVQAFGLERDHE